MDPVLARYERITSGAEKPESEAELAEAHHFLAMDFLAKGDKAGTLRHTREAFGLYERLGHFSSDYEREKLREWLKVLGGK